jgi:hypothetical protein
MAPYNSMSRFVASKIPLPRHMPAFATTHVGSPTSLLQVSKASVNKEFSTADLRIWEPTA